MMEIVRILDEKILILIQEYIRQPWANGFWITVTHLGDFGWFWIISALVLLICKKTRVVGLSALISLAAGALITNMILKNVVERIRPYDTIPDLILLIERQSDFSFPSGHTCASFAAATALYLYLPRKWGCLFLIFACLIAFSRLYVGVHYPSDVAAGAVIGVGCGYFGYMLVRKIGKQ